MAESDDALFGFVLVRLAGIDEVGDGGKFTAKKLVFDDDADIVKQSGRIDIVTAKSQLSSVHVLAAQGDIYAMEPERGA